MVEDTREHKKVEGELEGEERRRFTRAILTDLRALERMLDEGLFDDGPPRIGAEQEMFLIDCNTFEPVRGALKMLEALNDPHFTTELGMFQLEMNADPQPFSGRGLSALEAQLQELLERVHKAGAQFGIVPVLVGILPTIRKSDLGLDSMVPSPRYLALNAATTAMRGEHYDVSIKGIDEIHVKHDSVMVEACNSSFQVHLQVSPIDFTRLYNLSQALVGPVLAASGNSPLLFGKRLWAETRIALFEQAVDTRKPGTHLRDATARVWFGNRWCRGGILEIFKEDVARFRSLVGTDLDEDALEMLEQGRIPHLKALRLHNGTVYRWNRACYGYHPQKPHLRIEMRVLPSGPTIVDEVANAALWLGLMSELGARIDDVQYHMEFEQARANLYAAARDGLGAHMYWLDGVEKPAQALLLDDLLPAAEAGLRRVGIDEGDIQRYLSVIEKRIRTTRTGARWMLQSLAEMKDRGTLGERITAIVAAMVKRQRTGRPVADWERARFDEIPSARSSYLKVSQYMTTDIFTVRPDDDVQLVADLMGWERIRHIPVEDNDGRLVGLVSYRSVLRFFSDLLSGAQRDGKKSPSLTPVSDVMRREVITVTPETETLEAIRLMRRYRIGCLPVVQDGHLVGILTEEDFMGIAADLLEQSLAKDEGQAEKKEGASSSSMDSA
ncbi:MAG: glutamate-cysteine ligase family protein, partial [Sandaracinaceae bacterium]|nr:glutamate-cysteine ligase family protein [Sandaracinaceae bacterium]